MRGLESKQWMHRRENEMIVIMVAAVAGAAVAAVAAVEADDTICDQKMIEAAGATHSPTTIINIDGAASCLNHPNSNYNRIHHHRHHHLVNIPQYQ